MSIMRIIQLVLVFISLVAVVFSFIVMRKSKKIVDEIVKKMTEDPFRK